MAIFKALLLLAILCVIETNARRRYTYRYTPESREARNINRSNWRLRTNDRTSHLQTSPLRRYRYSWSTKPEIRGSSTIDNTGVSGYSPNDNARRVEDNRIEPNTLGGLWELEAGPVHEVNVETVGADRPTHDNNDTGATDNNEVDELPEVGTGHVGLKPEAPRPGCAEKVARLCPEKFEAYPDPFCRWTLMYETSYNCCPYNRVLMCQ